MTDKLREAAQQALGALMQADQRDGMYSYELEIAALRAALAQQDAHMQPASDADMTVYRGIAANYHKDKADLTQQGAQAELPIIRQNKLLADALASCILASGIVRTDIDGLTGPQLLLFAADLREMLETKKAQQDAQAVAQDEIVAAWKSGMTVQYFVTIGHDDEWTDYTNPTPPDTSGTRLAWRVKPGQRSNAAPTPPAQRGCSSTSHVGLTDEEIEEVVRDYMNVENGLLKVHKTLIEEYEKKNGINRG